MEQFESKPRKSQHQTGWCKKQFDWFRLGLGLSGSSKPVCCSFGNEIHWKILGNQGRIFIFFNLKAFNKLFISSELWQSLRIFFKFSVVNYCSHYLHNTHRAFPLCKFILWNRKDLACFSHVASVTLDPKSFINLRLCMRWFLDSILNFHIGIC